MVRTCACHAHAEALRQLGVRRSHRHMGAPRTGDLCTVIPNVARTDVFVVLHLAALTPRTPTSVLN